MNADETEPAGQDSMMSSMDFIEVGVAIADLVQAVVRTNLRAMQELSRVENPQGLEALQRRFAGEYIASLQQGTMNLVNALKAL